MQINTDKADRFSCSQKIWLKQNPPVGARVHLTYLDAPTA